MRCPYCKERVKKGALRCKHCHAGIGGTEAGGDGVGYLQNGFDKINSECDAIEDKINVRTGIIFIRHQYTADELWQMCGRIESFAEKIRDDIEQWDAAGQLPQHIKLIYNHKAEDVHERLEMIAATIEQREPTLWEKVCSFFKRITAKLLPLFNFKLVSGTKDKKFIAGF
jgi:hypothetical protein